MHLKEGDSGSPKEERITKDTEENVHNVLDESNEPKSAHVETDDKITDEPQDTTHLVSEKSTSEVVEQHVNPSNGDQVQDADGTDTNVEYAEQYNMATGIIKTAMRRAFLSLLRFSKFGVKCSYADAGVKDTGSFAIDVEAYVKAERLVVLGGSGFVGSAICKAAASRGIEVINLSRSGRPTSLDSWEDQVTWITGDVFYVNWDEVLPGATAVISTLGGFGTEEQMQRINVEANIISVNAAKEYGIPKFVLISVHDYNIPSFLLTNGYFTGKRKAEAEVLSKYPSSGVVLRPGFIYGKRKVGQYEIPLDLIGEPIEKLLNATASFTKPLSSLPASDLILAPPVVKDDDCFGVFTIDQIKQVAAGVKV